jgi:F-type H+-transporting ATPase subunit b
MSLLVPDTGLVFWMLVAFLILLFIVGKYGFPTIVGMVDKRKNFIDESLLAAKEANERLAGIKEEGERLLQQAREEHASILKDAEASRQRIVGEAREEAKAEGARMIAEAKQQIQTEKDAMMGDLRRQVADLSVAIAEKILREKINTDSAQMSLIDRMLDEAERNRK